MGARKITVKESAAESIAAIAWFIESKGLITAAESSQTEYTSIL